MSEWIRVDEQLPPEGERVETKIDDERGMRNYAVLFRQGNLWFFADGSMHVYYVPTHWRTIEQEGGCVMDDTFDCFDCLEDDYQLLCERRLQQQEKERTDCLNCGMCKSCIDLAIAYYEEWLSNDD